MENYKERLLKLLDKSDTFISDDDRHPVNNLSVGWLIENLGVVSSEGYGILPMIFKKGEYFDFDSNNEITFKLVGSHLNTEERDLLREYSLRLVKHLI